MHETAKVPEGPECCIALARAGRILQVFSEGRWTQLCSRASKAIISVKQSLVVCAQLTKGVVGTHTVQSVMSPMCSATSSGQRLSAMKAMTRPRIRIDGLPFIRIPPATPPYRTLSATVLAFCLQLRISSLTDIPSHSALPHVTDDRSLGYYPVEALWRLQGQTAFQLISPLFPLQR